MFEKNLLVHLGISYFIYLSSCIIMYIFFSSNFFKILDIKCVLIIKKGIRQSGRNYAGKF